METAARPDAIDGLAEHERRFYRFQTTGRGLNSPDDLRRHFDKQAIGYDLHLAAFLPDDREGPILDAPCGWGNFTHYLARRGYTRVTGVDFDQEQVRLARSLNLPAEQGDVFDHLDRPHAWAAIASIDFMEHLSKDRALQALDGFFAALQPGGVLILRVPSADGPFGNAHLGNDITHKWCLTARAWAAVLRMVGFDARGLHFIDERVPPSRGLARVRYRLANKALRWLYNASGIVAPKVMSRSMWVVAHKAAAPVISADASAVTAAET